MQYSLVGTDGADSVITVFVPGSKPLVAHASHPNFKAIVQGAIEDDEGIVKLFDIVQEATTRFERLSERITAANGRLYFDGEEIDNALSQQVARFLSEGVENWKPLVKFFENVQTNPSEHSREQLYGWLKASDFSITDDGLIVGYKGVQKLADGGFVSCNAGRAIVDGEVKTGQIPNYKGAVVEMPRNEVTFDPAIGCSQGLHVGTYDYAESFARGALLEVHVNPRDVVSVPSDSSQQKMRVCRYTVIDTIEQPYTSSVIFAYDDDDDWDAYNGDEDWEDDESGYDHDPGYDPNDEPVDDLDLNDVVETVIQGIEGYGTVALGDVFEDTDKRRPGRTFKVESIEDDYAVGKSLPQNVTRKVRLDRLTSRKYRKV